jgi:hypothetical protein
MGGSRDRLIWAGLVVALSVFRINVVEGLARTETLIGHGVAHTEMRPVVEPKHVLVLNVAEDIRERLFVSKVREYGIGEALYFSDDMTAGSGKERTPPTLERLAPFRKIQLSNRHNEARLREPGHLNGGGFSEVGVFHPDLQLLIGLKGRIKQDEYLRPYPSTLIYLHRIASLNKRQVQPKEAKYSNCYPSYCDPVEAASCTKLRLAGTSLLGVSLVVLGGGLLNYGERLGNIRYNISWWSGYWIAVAGSMALIVVFISLASHWILMML